MFGENDCKLNIFFIFFNHFVLNTIMHFEKIYTKYLSYEFKKDFL